MFWAQLMNSMYMLDARIMNCNLKLIWLHGGKYPNLLCTYTWNEWEIQQSRFILLTMAVHNPGSIDIVFVSSQWYKDRCLLWFHDNSSTDISSTTLRLQTFCLQTFRLLLYTRVQDSYSITSNFCFSKSLFSSIPTFTYTMIPFINPTSNDTMIIQHI